MVGGLRRAFAFVFAAVAAAPASAQDYPAREIRSICNFSAGSGADILVRFYSDKLSKLIGKPVVVENKGGAHGNIATDFVAKAKPDGHTILITPASSTLAAAPHLFKALSFDPLKDFAPVTTLARLAFVIAVDAARPIRTIADLTAHLKAKKDHGSYGTGSNTGVATAELYKHATGLMTLHVPYRSPATALNDMAGGQIDFMAYDSTWSVGQVRGGKLRVLAVTSAQRLSALSDVPTMAELGFAGYDLTPWWGVVVPAGTPRPIVAKLTGWFNEIATSADARNFLVPLATEPFPGSPESMAALIKAEHERWRDIVKLAKIEPL